MEFGVCGGPEVAEAAAAAGFDFAEWNVASLLNPRETEEVFASGLEARRQIPLDYPVANGFVPGKLKITGPDVEEQVLADYVAVTMARAERAGVGIIVFGSGGARGVPDGFDRQRAHDQLVAFCRMTGPLAADHGVTVVVEPLNSGECNVITTVAEGARLVEETDHPAVRLLADGYHMLRENDNWADLVRYGHLLAHVHLATRENRRAPAAEPEEFGPFFDALRQAGYSGRVSIEARLQDASSELPAALTEMRRLAGG